MDNLTKANHTIDHFPARIAAITALLLSIARQAVAAAPGQDARPGSGHSDSTVSDAAAEAEFQPDLAVCLEQHPAVRPSEHCTAEEIGFQDARLDAEFRVLLNSLHGATRDALQVDQQHWSQTRNDECLVFGRRQVSLGSMRAQDCFLYGAARRRVMLERQYGTGRR